MANIIPRREERSLAVPFTRELGGLWRDPFETMRELLNFDPLNEIAWSPRTFVPAFEVKETADSYVFKADMPGVKEEDVDVSITGNRLTISGKRETEKEEEDKDNRYYAAERSYGAFTRSFTLPEGVDSDHVRADLKSGVLTVALQKTPEAQPRKIALGKKDEKARA